jgi:radical SAM superfamily enzyme YgiQ (UPF0313 family)
MPGGKPTVRETEAWTTKGSAIASVSLCIGREESGGMEAVEVTLISTYELGRQSFTLASCAAWLQDAGLTVRCVDLSVDNLQDTDFRNADLVAVSLPMHTATRLAVQVIQKIKQANPAAHLCAIGLYAPLNESYLRRIGIDTVLGGEFESELVELSSRLMRERAGSRRQHSERRSISLERLSFRTPDRSGLPALNRYARLELGKGESRTVGYTEATRGCKHLCRHCPIVPVYGGAFRVIQRDVVLEDIRNQIASGAEHITFGDPDFFNGPTHGLAIVEALHREFPKVTYDVTIKVEHLLQHQERLPRLRATGCAFVTSAIESLDEYTLEQFDKRHTKADFIEVIRLFRNAGLILSPTFIPFTPWTQLEHYKELLETLVHHGLVDQVAPVQLSIRLLVTHGSRLLELSELRQHLTGEFDEERLVYPWAHADPRVDALQRNVAAIASDGVSQDEPRRTTFRRILELVQERFGEIPSALLATRRLHEPSLVPIPRLTEPWYC